MTLPLSIIPVLREQMLALPPAPLDKEEEPLRALLRVVQALSHLLPREKAQARKTLVIGNPRPRHYVLGMLDPNDVDAKEDLARFLKTRTASLTCHRLDPMEFDVAFRNAYEGEAAAEYELKAAARRSAVWNGGHDAAPVSLPPAGADNFSTVVDLTDQAEFQRNLSRPEVELTNREFTRLALREFVNAGASDLHAESSNEGGRIRFRCDGVLFTRWSGIPLPRMREICSAFAQMARVQSTDMKFTRLDSSIQLRVLRKGQPVNVEFRFSSVPAIPQPEIVLRSQSQVIRDLDRVGLLDFQLEALRLAMSQPQGIILVTGPTGSGKTNTLEGVFTELSAAGDSKIIEIADPPEIVSPGRTQIPITGRFSWMDGFLSAMRQDPETIAVGELRSREAVHVALDAALTGHLVLATFHTVDVETTFTRLFKMEIPSDLLADALNAVHSQRLVRILCPECKQVDQAGSISFGVTVYAPRGCAACYGTGWKGRTAIGEVLLVREEIKDWIRGGFPPPRIVAQARKYGWLVSMKDVARLKVKEGSTSLAEVQRVMRLTVQEMAGGSQERPAAYYESEAAVPTQNPGPPPVHAPDDYVDADYVDVTE
jgi:type II secretory ATPase GspE/PulE/Tfp pilus assembly ATPase PilB-like protein